MPGTCASMNMKQQMKTYQGGFQMKQVFGNLEVYTDPWDLSVMNIGTSIP